MKQPKCVVAACQRLRQLVLFERAGFSLDPSKGSSNADTEAIRKATRVYTESWVLPLIDAIERGDTQTLQRMRL